MTAIKYRTPQEAMAAVKLSLARKKEWIARVEREWAEEDVMKIRSTQ